MGNVADVDVNTPDRHRALHLPALDDSRLRDPEPLRVRDRHRPLRLDPRRDCTLFRLAARDSTSSSSARGKSRNRRSAKTSAGRRFASSSTNRSTRSSPRRSAIITSCSPAVTAKPSIGSSIATWPSDPRHRPKPGALRHRSGSTALSLVRPPANHYHPHEVEVSVRWSSARCRLRASNETRRGHYSNLALISHRKEEFIVDFLFIDPQSQSPQEGQAILTSRVVLNPGHMRAPLSGHR